MFYWQEDNNNPKDLYKNVDILFHTTLHIMVIFILYYYDSNTYSLMIIINI